MAKASDFKTSVRSETGTTRTISSDLALTASDVFAQHIKADVDKVRVSLADATNLDKGLVFGIYNRGLTGNDLIITDADGNPLIAQLGQNAGLMCMLHDNAASDGTWGITYDNGSGITLTGVSAQVTELVATSDDVTGTMLDTSVGISIYADSNRSNKLFSRVVDFSQNPVALLGSELEVDTVGVLNVGYRHGIRHVDTQDALAAYRDFTNGNVLAVLLRWDGASLTIADGPFTVETHDLQLHPIIARLSSTEFVVCYDDASNNNPKAALLDVSSSTISKSDSITISTDDVNAGSVVEFDSTFSVFVWFNTTNNRVDVALLKWDGTNLTNPNSITGLNVNGTNFSSFNISKVNSTQVVVVLDEGSNDNIELHLLDVDTNNEAISSTDNLVLTSIGASNSQAGLPQILSERTNFVGLAAEDGSGNRVVLEFSISSNTITQKQTLLDNRESRRLNPLVSLANPPSIYDVPVVGGDQNNSGNISATKFGLSKLQVTP